MSGVVDESGDLPVIQPTTQRGLYACCGKRATDVVVSVLSLVLLSPVLLVTAILVAIFLGRPVLFRQRRPGKGGQPFEMIKFRSMTDARDENGELLSDDIRLTGFGRFLRASSLDELPELWNVLKGEMSVVGPRPLLWRYLHRYSPEQFRRHAVRPGVTGWAQVNGRNAISWDEKFRFDLWYVDHFSPLVDLKILFMTVWKIVARSGVSAEGHATMPEFGVEED